MRNDEPAREPLLAVSGLSLRLDGRSILKDAGFSLAAHRMLGVLGPSGCGKSTLLRVIARLQAADCGAMVWAGRRLDLAHLPGAADIYPALTMVQQTFPLFPGMPLRRVLRILEGVDEAFALQLAARLGVEVLLDARPERLSVGQRQRLAFIRALALRPRLLLLDEPTSALDDVSAQLLLRLTRDYVENRAGTCAVLVTHDRNKAAAYCDDVLEMGEAK